MLLKIDDVEIAVYPNADGFKVTPLDIDDGESTVRTADGTLNRDRITVKRQIDMTFGRVPWAKISTLLKSMQNPYFTFYYPDPMEGMYITKTFYVGNRPTPFAIEDAQGNMYWDGLSITLTEK